jgi:peroxiredoxin
MTEATSPANQREEIEAMSSSIPEPIASRIDRAVAEIEASGVAPGLSIGERAPAFTLTDAYGEAVSLSALLARGPVVLTFYRGEWCPFCNVQLRHLQRALPLFERWNATLVAVSPQAPDHGVSLSEKYELGFPVLSDLDQSVIRAYKVQFTLTGDLEDLQVNVFQNDPGRQNADGSRSLPVPATFVIDQDGVVRGAFVSPDWRVRVEPEDVAAVLERLA